MNFISSMFTAEQNAFHILLFYLFIMNAAGFIAMGRDKRKARRRAFRTPESVLLMYAILGGSIGCILGMYFFRHKTRKLKFSLGLPVILILQIACAAALYFTAGSVTFQ